MGKEILQRLAFHFTGLPAAKPQCPGYFSAGGTCHPSALPCSASTQAAAPILLQGFFF